jgi:hypothetical protein
MFVTRHQIAYGSVPKQPLERNGSRQEAFLADLGNHAKATAEVVEAAGIDHRGEVCGAARKISRPALETTVRAGVAHWRGPQPCQSAALRLRTSCEIETAITSPPP